MHRLAIRLFHLLPELCYHHAGIRRRNLRGISALYVEATLNNVAAPTNSSPVFSNIPVSFLCIGQVFHYNHGAYNTDGDSITYSFITPRSAANTNVTFNAGYTTNSPLSSSPAMSIDASGDITVAPTQTEVGVLAIIVREYRNGVLVGSVIRDMQIWTVPCSNLLPTATGINGTNNFQIVACPGRPLNFTVNSADANASQTVSMNWNYAIPGATFTPSAASRPVGTFSWTPTIADARPQPYSFTVTVQDNNCPSAGFQTYSYDVLVPLECDRHVHQFPLFKSCERNCNGIARRNRPLSIRLVAWRRYYCNCQQPRSRNLYCHHHGYLWLYYHSIDYSHRSTSCCHQYSSTGKCLLQKRQRWRGGHHRFGWNRTLYL